MSSIFFLNMFVSGFLLAVISMDRCLVVLKPVWARHYRNIQRTGRVCGFIWALAVLCTIPFYIYRDTIQLPNGKIMCYYHYAQLLPSGIFDLGSLCKQREKILAFMRLSLAFLIPLIIIILSYTAVNASLAHRGCRRPFRFVRLVVSVVVSFVLCWAPFHLFSVMQVVAPKGHPAEKLAAKALPISATIGFLNSILNPILYVFSCPDLCKKIRQSLGAVMESVLAEDLTELARRRNTARSINNSGIVLQQRNSIQTTSMKTEEQEQEEVFINSAQN
ncbi:prostaglandin D2 receptor 2-like [Scomber scombrus]|uniref:Prostaglandin D2 receptor 2-like n=1 Tax=Scomber scombrus TaxID=13677 RepID=A0AAV1PQ58_SCOSC